MNIRLSSRKKPKARLIKTHYAEAEADGFLRGRRTIST
nr:hypothetical protein [Escherichia coli]